MKEMVLIQRNRVTDEEEELARGAGNVLIILDRAEKLDETGCEFELWWDHDDGYQEFIYSGSATGCQIEAEALKNEEEG